MEADSPLKQFIQRISPVKRRDKPLPDPPASSKHSAPQPKVLKPISSNTSPSKPTATSKTNTKSRLRSFLGKRQTEKPASPPSSSHRRSQATHRSPHGIHKSIRNRHGSQDLRRLTQKVSDLEAQLKATKRELKNVSTHTSRPTSVEREQILDAEKLRRQLASVRKDEKRYDGLAEHLLSQSYRDRNGVYRTLACKSTDDLGRAVREQEALEADSGEDEDEARVVNLPGSRNSKSQDCITLVADGDLQDQKQRRSALRRKSWNHIQTQLESERELERGKRRVNSTREDDPAGQPYAKRSRRSSSFDVSTLARDKDLPPIKDSPMSMTQDQPDITPEPSQPVPKPIKNTSAHRSRKSLPNPPTEILAVPKLSPPIEAAPKQPRKGNHKRRQSIIISRDEVDEALSPERPRTRGKQISEQSVNWTTHASSTHAPPSPGRKCAGSPSRLERVEEEYEWDEDVF